MADESWVVRWPTLFVGVDWIEAHCVIPDGAWKGAPLELLDWQAWFLLNHYRVKPGALPAFSRRRDRTEVKPASAFHYRRSQMVLPQKAGKSPLTAAQITLEGVGPAVFAGWAEGGEEYDCVEHGCPCGWGYVYEPGEPMGMQWPTPLIQVTAFSEEQTDNVYSALRPMIEDGPLANVVPRVGEEFTRLPGGGRIDTVTSSAKSRLGQRVTFVPQGETGIWTPGSGMIEVAETQRRGLAGMGGRAVEETNAWDRTENSVAQRTAESTSEDIFRLHPLAPAGLSYTNKAERRKIHRHVYAGCWHVDLDVIEGEAGELLQLDPTQAERYFGNRPVAGGGVAYRPGVWDELADSTVQVEDGAVITVGVDGARFDDALAIVATDVESGHQWPLGIWEKPDHAGDDYEHPVAEVDGAMVEAFETFKVWRCYVDPQFIDDLLDRWQGRWGAKRVIPWWTNRPVQMAHAVRRHVTAVHAGDLSHDGDPVMARHIRNCTKRKVNARDEQHRQMFVLAKDRPDSPRKIDAGPAAVLAWEARGDAVAAGVLKRAKQGRRKLRARSVG
ncbi:MAG: hypothetical protein ACODAF_01500 [Actinomycetota bacterium]